MLTFHQPLWIAAGFVCCLIAWLLAYRYERIRAKLLSRFGAAALIPKLTAGVSYTRRRLKKWLALTAVFLCFAALARPQYGHHWVNVKHKGIDILFALDLSKSMLAEDIRPNRLERSKLAVMDFVSTLTGDRVGLMPFSGASFLMCPLTADYTAFEQTLTALDHNTIPVGGTDITAAIDNALSILSGSANHKILVIISDGEQLRGDVAGAARRAAENEMIIHTVGIGTESGELIPDPEGDGFIQDSSGAFVKSRLDRTNLELIAETAGGLFVNLGDRGQGLAALYEQRLALVPETELAEKRKQVPMERFGWPLMLAVLLLCVEMLISDRKPEPGAGFPFLKTLSGRFRRTAGIVILLHGAAGLHPLDVYSSEAEKAYVRGDYIEAGQLYEELLAKDPHNSLILFNSGTTAYKNNLYDDAVEAFNRALESDDLDLQAKSYFNRGNALFRIGEAALQAQPDQTINSWERAVASYESTLELNPDNEQARANRDFVQKKLEQLKQQHEQQDQDSQNDQADSDQQENDENHDRQQDNTSESEPQNSEQSSTQAQSAQSRNRPDEPHPGNEGINPQNDENPAGEQPEPADQPQSPGQPDPSGQQAEPAGMDQNESSENQRAAAARQGSEQMSREEALRLLQAMKGEEQQMELLIPQSKEQSSPTQDW